MLFTLENGLGACDMVMGLCNGQMEHNIKENGLLMRYQETENSSSQTEMSMKVVGQ